MDAQIWINQTFPLNQRAGIRKLLISIPSEQNTSYHRNIYDDYEKHYLSDTLTGQLNLSTFPNLTHLSVEYQRLVGLNLNRNRKLRDIGAQDNLLQTIIFPQRADKLYRVHIPNNDIRPRDLSVFANYPRLKNLLLGTNNINQIQQGIYNRWQGSLSPLRNLNRLQELDINATDISQGLQFIPTRNLYYFTCGDKGRVNATVNQIKRSLGFTEAIASEDADMDILLRKVDRINDWKNIHRSLIAQIQQVARHLLHPRNQ